MNGDKKEKIIELAVDHEMIRQVNLATLNWEIAMNRVELIAQEREEGINDDKGVEMIPVFVRMERVYDYLFSLLFCPQAYLLPSVVNRLKPFIKEESMDGELVRLMAEKDDSEPAFWTMLSKNKIEGTDDSSKTRTKLYKLVTRYITPHLAEETINEVMDVLTDGKTLTELVSKDHKKGLSTLGRKLKETANANNTLMATGLLMRHSIVEQICMLLDMQNHEYAMIANVFELAKRQLMESDAWHVYWTDHKRLLELKGSPDEQWKQDAEETEQWLLNLHGYLYNKWNEGPEAFGQALKRERLDDDTILLLLFYLAKKDAIAIETEKPDERREKMEEGAFETAMKLHELAAEKYFKDYVAIWRRIIKSENISLQLLNYNSSKYNQGFNMMCLCKIVGYLHRKYHFYGSHTPEEMGKFLGDRYVKNSHGTFTNYIKKKNSTLNEQCFSELDEALKNN